MRSIRVGGAKKKDTIFIVSFFFVCVRGYNIVWPIGQHHFVQSKNITPFYAGKYVYALLGVDLLLRNLL